MTDSIQKNYIQNLTSAFNELRKYNDTTFVIKCNSLILEDNDLLKAFAEDVVSLKSAGINVIVIHDGNNVVHNMMDKFGLKGMSANACTTDQATVEIVEMIISGHVNKKIVFQINLAGGNAVGISGKDGNFMVAKRTKIARYNNDNDTVLNFGFMGELALINPDILLILEDSELIPVIAPIAIGDDQRTYKIDANDVTAAVAAILSASKLIFMSDDPSLLDKDGNILANLSVADAQKMIQDDKNDTSLSSKLRASLMAFEQNTEMVHIIDGKIPHALMLELFTDELVGTKISE